MCLLLNILANRPPPDGVNPRKTAGDADIYIKKGDVFIEKLQPVFKDRICDVIKILLMEGPQWLSGAGRYASTVINITSKTISVKQKCL